MHLLKIHGRIRYQIKKGHRKGGEVKKMESVLLKSYNGFTIEKSWNLKSDGTIDKDSIIYSAYDSDGDLVTASNNLIALKKELR